MPASDTKGGRAGGRLLSLLFWAGVALAPVAATLLLLTKGERPLRIAAVLAVLAVVLIGLSISLRKNSESVRLELEETFLEEVDLLREDLRQDIATAARATHRQFSEKLQALYEHVEAVRYERAGQQFAGPPMPNPIGQGNGGVPGRAHAGGHIGTAQVGAPNGGGHAGPPPPGVGRAGVPGPGPVVGGGVVRHTETVQVTTRQTIVDPHGDGTGGRGTVYGGAGTSYAPGRGSYPHTGPSYPSTGYGQAQAPSEPSWTEQRLRERLGDRMVDPRPDHRGAGPDARRPRSSHGRDGDDTGAGERWDTDRPAESSWSSRRASAGTVQDRWATVRSDDRGHELRMGERRAALHADESGSELHIEDRWASVRRDEPGGRRRAEDRRAEDRRAEDRRAGDRRDDDWRAEDWRSEDGRSEDRRSGDWRAGDRRDDDRRAEDWRSEDRLVEDRGGDDQRAEDRRTGDRWSEDRWGPGVEDTGRWGERWTQPALPAASSEPSWSDRWSETRGGRRRRYRDEDADEESYAWEAQLADPPVRSRERWG